MPCELCTDPDGVPCYPSYGVAPHTCFYKLGKSIGQSEILPRDQWPENFEPDPENPGCGTWWCPRCGDGKPHDVERTSSRRGAMRRFSLCYGLALRVLVAMFPYVLDESCVKARRLCMRSYWKNAA